MNQRIHFAVPILKSGFNFLGAIRERTLSMQEGGPEGFTNFSKKVL